MHITKVITLLACFSTGAMSFKVRAFSGKDCTGSAKEINVWGNTCRDQNVPDTKSVRVLSYGAHRQRATFWKNKFCSNSPPPQIMGDWWADGGSDTFIKGKCVNLKGTSKAFGSRSA